MIDKLRQEGFDVEEVECRIDPENECADFLERLDEFERLSALNADHHSVKG